LVVLTSKLDSVDNPTGRDRIGRLLHIIQMRVKSAYLLQMPGCSFA
jgi:hypothetical protein